MYLSYMVQESHQPVYKWEESSENWVKLFIHPPQSLDLAPSDFHLLLPTQNVAHRHMFRDYSKVTEEVKMPLQQNSQVFSGGKRQTKIYMGDYAEKWCC